jgi:hypothetical protein
MQSDFEEAYRLGYEAGLKAEKAESGCEGRRDNKGIQENPAQETISALEKKIKDLNAANQQILKQLQALRTQVASLSHPVDGQFQFTIGLQSHSIRQNE